MHDAWRSATASALLVELFDQDNRTAWDTLDRRYRPVIIAFARRLGLGAADAADAAQETLTRFLQAYRANRYDRNRGRLRSWIIGIARNCIADIKRNRAARRERDGASMMADLPDEHQLDAIWETECQRAILWQALEELRRSSRLHPKTIEAFRLCGILQQPASAVAEELGMTVMAVYVAKHRCLAQLREIVKRLAALYEDEAMPVDD
jgi:RNA polymerase sigma-70 factor (ECF subfamily)